MIRNQKGDRVFMVLAIVLAVTFGAARAPAEPLSGIWSWQRGVYDAWPFSLPASEIRFMFGPDGTFLAVELQTREDVIPEIPGVLVGLTDWNPVLPAGQQSVWYMALTVERGVNVFQQFSAKPTGGSLSYDPQTGQVSWTARIETVQRLEAYGMSLATRVDYEFVLSGQLVPGSPDRIDWTQVNATRSVDGQDPQPIPPMPGTAPLFWSKAGDIASIESDADGDGVPDFRDYCPDTPVVSPDSVSVSGCSASQRDSDGDGVTDDADACPGTHRGTAVGADGCETLNPPSDSDGDGVSDDRDVCPDTPEGTQVAANGCPAAPLGGTWILLDHNGQDTGAWVRFNPQGMIEMAYRPHSAVDLLQVEILEWHPELLAGEDTLWFRARANANEITTGRVKLQGSPLLLDGDRGFVSWVDQSDVILLVNDIPAVEGSWTSGEGEISADGRRITWTRVEPVNGLVSLSPVLVLRSWLLDECPNDPAKTESGACGCEIPEGSCDPPPADPSPPSGNPTPPADDPPPQADPIAEPEPRACVPGLCGICMSSATLTLGGLSLLRTVSTGRSRRRSAGRAW